MQRREQKGSGDFITDRVTDLSKANISDAKVAGGQRRHEFPV
jgi:hypothetical protein